MDEEISIGTKDDASPGGSTINKIRKEPDEPPETIVRRRRKFVDNALTVLEKDPLMLYYQWSEKYSTGNDGMLTFVQCFFEEQSEIDDKINNFVIDRKEKVMLGGSDYQRYCVEEKGRFWEDQLLCTFSYFQVIATTQKHIAFLDEVPVNYNPDFNFARDYIVKPFSNDITKVCTIMYANAHFGVLVYDIPSRHVSIYDGKGSEYNIGVDIFWAHHIKYVVKRVSNINHRDEITVSHVTHLEHPNMERKINVYQKDSCNCGPIACLVIWSLFDCESALSSNLGNSLHYKDGNLREIIIEELQRKVKMYGKYLLANTRYEKSNFNDEQKVDGKLTQMKTNANTALVQGTNRNKQEHEEKKMHGGEQLFHKHNLNDQINEDEEYQR